MKKCKKCGVLKDIKEFKKNTKMSAGVLNFCRDCENKRALSYYYANKEKYNERAKKWAKDNIERRRITQLKWQRENRRKVKEYNDKFNNGEKALALKENSICEWCGTKEDLCIHHEDNKGHSIPRSDRNNNINNLKVLCRSCHAKLHRANNKLTF